MSGLQTPLLLIFLGQLNPLRNLTLLYIQ